MTHHQRPLAFLAVLGLLSLPAWAGEAPPSPLIFAGSGTNLTITRLLVEAYTRLHPAVYDRFWSICWETPSNSPTTAR
jgi:hypothetical protein